MPSTLLRRIAARLLAPGSVTALVLALAPGAGAEIFRWTDDSGRLHFTERLDQVPERYRKQAAQRAASDPEPAGNFQTYGDGALAGAGSTASWPSAAQSRRRVAGPGREIHIPFVREGSLMRVDVRINDLLTAPFYIDSGASGVSLPAAYAERLGIRVRHDTPHIRVSTANGVVARPLVKLDSVQLGAARVEGLTATINPAMNVGLLGGEFFNNFVYRVDAAVGVISLLPNERIRGGLGPGEWRERFQHTRDLIDQIDAYLEQQEVRKSEREQLERRRTELQDALDELEREANRLDVPYAWRD